MANVRIVILKEVEVVRDEPKAKPGHVVTMPAAQANELVKKKVAVLYGDFTSSMIPGYKTEEEKALEEATKKAKREEEKNKLANPPTSTETANNKPN
jgi:hypothetical protein